MGSKDSRPKAQAPENSAFGLFVRRMGSLNAIVIRGVYHEDTLELQSFGTVHGAEADHRRLRKLLSTQTMPRHARAFEPRLDHVQQICLTRKHGNVIRRAPDPQQLADLCRYKVTLLRSSRE